VSKVVLITGGSRGIGAATARVLAAEGYDVAVNYAGNAEAAAAVVLEIQAAGQRAIAVQADTADPAAVKTMFETVDRELGPLTALVNNAGVITQRGRLDELTDETIERMIAVNIKGYIHCTREAVKRMSTKHGGSGGAIVNVSSGSAHLGSPNDSILYAMTKGAVNSLTVGLSQELAKEGVRVNTVAPGLVETDMPGPEAIARRAPSLPTGRAGQPEEIAHGISYLLSEKASYTSGANLRIAGGRI